MNKKIGFIVMFDISSCGGAPKVILDTIKSLNSINVEVHLLTPFRLNHANIEKCCGHVEIKKIYYPDKIKSVLCKGNFLPRRFMRKEIQQMAKEVDLIIDIDGGIIHKYLPKNFDKYVVWRFSVYFIFLTLDWTLKRKLKEYTKILLGSRRCIPSQKYKIYAHDEWTKKELSKHWDITCEDMCLYAGVKIDDFCNKEIKKKKQISVFGRITPNKMIENSIHIFARGTKNYSDYHLIIFGGGTADSKDYIKKLNKLIEELEISKRVTIIESPSFEEIKKFLSESKIIINAQSPISISQTSIEALAAGNIVLSHKNNGVYTELLDEGKFGFGFNTIEEGGEKLQEIIKSLENKKLSPWKFSKRAEFFSDRKHLERYLYYQI
ncbi:MAG: glycosyltransferase, partial [Candidatus Pacearchaeota archaeon]|nr:glycosyltransferase [Candidatus Pacearchaeota archaeon]